MKMEIKSSHLVTFYIKEFIDNEGGMTVEEFGQVCVSMEEALETLMIAKKFKPTQDWVIVCKVDSKVTED